MKNGETLLPGNLLGGMLLVAGSCIGAGMLALPILTGLAGFFPSMLMMILAWAFMTFTGLLLIEANGWFYKQVNLVSMAKESLGSWGKWISWICYVFLFYSLLVAYVAASGSVFSSILKSFFDFSASSSLSSIFFTFLFGVLVYFGTRPVDLFNRILMGGLIFSYLGMVFWGLSKVNFDLLAHTSSQYVFISLPVLVVSFGFQNMIPSLTAYMKGDLQRVRWTIIGGSLIALVVYLIWSFLVLGVVPFSGKDSLFQAYQTGQEASHVIQAALGSSWVTAFSQVFAFFAIVTSFIAQGLTLTHFLADGFRIDTSSKKIGFLTVLALLPPLLFALYNPQIFIKALSLAGGVFAVILFGILPILMVWLGRYKKGLSSNYHVRGGKISLLLGLLFALTVMFFELSRYF